MLLWIEYELCRSGQDESRLDNPLDGLARMEYAMPMLYVELPEYHGVRQW